MCVCRARAGGVSLVLGVPGAVGRAVEQLLHCFIPLIGSFFLSKRLPRTTWAGTSEICPGVTAAELPLLGTWWEGWRGGLWEWAQTWGLVVQGFWPVICTWKMSLSEDAAAGFCKVFCLWNGSCTASIVVAVLRNDLKTVCLCLLILLNMPPYVMSREGASSLRAVDICAGEGVQAGDIAPLWRQKGPTVWCCSRRARCFWWLLLFHHAASHSPSRPSFPAA